jgi:serine/threonine-protein kinase
MTDDTPPTSAGSPPEPPKAKPASTVTTGTLIMGTYEIEKLINSGGMGEVYRGRNIHNGEPVAIKIVLPSLAHDAKIVALFQKESTVLSRLAHEAIVRYHVFTNDPTIGRPCMVMEFVSGLPLADRIEQGPMPLDDVKVMLRRVASGLDKAHRAGVVHRDLSPDNVILEEGMVEHAKLIDFGIAKSSNFGSGTLLQGQFAGKFNWVSPEQLGAYGGHVDGRSDIYSLALITAGVSRGEVLQMGASIVDAVSKRATVPALDGVDPALVPLLTWMLQPDPAKRVDSMATVMAALDNPALIPQEAPPAPPVPDPNRTVIEPLPVIAPPTAPPVPAQTAPPVSAATSAPPTGQTAPPAGWPATAAPPAQTTPPDGATVIAPHPVATLPPMAGRAEDEDASPFGLPAGPVAAAVAPVSPAVASRSGGKGGLITVLILLAVLGGGAGAYFGGFLGGGKPEPEVKTAGTGEPAQTTGQEPAASDEVARAEAAKAAAEAAQKAAEDEAAKAARAAEELAAQEKAAQEKVAAEARAAEERAAAEAAAKAAQDQAAREKAEAEARLAAEAAAKATVDTAQSRAEGASAARGIAENALAEAEAAVKDLDGATDAAAAATVADRVAGAAERSRAAAQAAEGAAADIRQRTAELAAFPELSEQVTKLLAAAEADRDAATKASAAAALAATKAAESVKTLAAAEAAKAAEEKARADALAADPVARQQAFFDSLKLPPCTWLALEEAAPAGFRLAGYAVDTAPLEQVAKDWEQATGVKPDIGLNLINDEQCPTIAFMADKPELATVRISFGQGGGVVKSGSRIDGKITGLDGRPYTVFLVNGDGGATNLGKRVTTEADGSASFSFGLRLKEGAPPTPQLLLVVVGDEAQATALASVKPNVLVKQLMAYIDGRLGDVQGEKAFGLAFFRLEN